MMTANKSLNNARFGNSVGKIDKVDPASDFHKSTGGRWIPILKAFNPLGAIADGYAKTLAYKLETKRLDVELVRINKQADIATDVIDKTFKLKMEELAHRRIALIGFYQTVNNELERLHIERVKVLEMAQLAQQKAFENGLTIEERQMFKEMAIEITRELPHFGDKSNESLQKLVQALPPVMISPKLLEG
jgi:hypothetical protein